MIAVAAALVSGAMFYLSQGLDNAWYLAWFAATPLLWLAYGRTPLWQVLLASFAAVLAGFIYVLQCYGGLAPTPLLLQVVAPPAVLFPFAIAFARLAQRRLGPLATLLAFPVCWTALEFLSQRAAPNGTYGSFAYSQMSAPLLIQSASLFGLYAVTFLLGLFANALALALRWKRENAIAIGLGFAICAANLAFGVARLTAPNAATIGVAAVVDQTATDNSWHAHSLPDILEAAQAYAGAIRGAASQGARFAVMPEGGIAAAARLRPSVIAPLQAVSTQADAQIIAGISQSQPVGDIALSLRPGGTPQEYAKRHLVPFLEDELTPGRGSGWLGDGRAVEICKDMDFPDTIRRDAARGVRLMGVPAGDFGKDGWLHARMAVMRGVENGFALVRAATGGLASASDAEGRLLAVRSDAPKGLTMVVAKLPLGPGPTLYTRIGDVLPWSCVVMLALLGLSSFGPRKAEVKTKA